MTGVCFRLSKHEEHRGLSGETQELTAAVRPKWAGLEFLEERFGLAERMDDAIPG